MLNIHAAHYRMTNATYAAVITKHNGATTVYQVLSTCHARRGITAHTGSSEAANVKTQIVIPNSNIVCRLGATKQSGIDRAQRQVTVQYNTVQYNTVQYNTVQYNTVRYITVQYSTAQYSTVH